MKYTYREMPESLQETYADFSRQFGFSWKEFMATVPLPDESGTCDENRA